MRRRIWNRRKSKKKRQFLNKINFYKDFNKMISLLLFFRIRNVISSFSLSFTAISSYFMHLKSLFCRSLVLYGAFFSFAEFHFALTQTTKKKIAFTQKIWSENFN